MSTTYVDLRTLGDWHFDGACHLAGVDMSRLNPDTRFLCDRCTVKDKCLISAMEEERGQALRQRFMVRGGLSGTQRFNLAASRRKCEFCEAPTNGKAVLCEPCRFEQLNDLRKANIDATGQSMTWRKVCLNCGLVRENAGEDQTLCNSCRRRRDVFVA